MHINSIERTERHFSKRTIIGRELSYYERLSVLNLDTLECRRLSCDLTLYYKVFKNLILGLQVNISMYVYNLKVYIPFHMGSIFKRYMCRTNTFDNDFFNRFVSAWNSLPIVFWLNQNLLPLLNIILELLTIYPHFMLYFLEFVCYFVCIFFTLFNVGFTLMVLYPAIIPKMHALFQYRCFYVAFTACFLKFKIK